MSSLFIVLGLFVISSFGIILYIFRDVSKKILHILIALGA